MGSLDFGNITLRINKKRIKKKKGGILCICNARIRNKFSWKLFSKITLSTRSRRARSYKKYNFFCNRVTVEKRSPEKTTVRNRISAKRTRIVYCFFLSRIDCDRNNNLLDFDVHVFLFKIYSPL